jgi:hypothetical protein
MHGFLNIALERAWDKRSAPITPLVHNGNQKRHQELTHLCKQVSIFFQRCLHAASFANRIFASTSLLIGSLIPGAAVPSVRAQRALRGVPVMDLSSREEDTFPGTSRDEEIARRLFADLNYSLLRPPGDGSVIVLSDSDEEEEVRENDHADVEVMSSSAETPQLQSPLPPMTRTQ